MPEDPSQPRGRTIALAVAVAPAISAHPAPDPVFWFSGWGGAGASDDAKDVLPALAAINVDRDIVFVDQRGTGATGTLCRLPGDAAAGAAARARVAEAARRCAERAGPGLAHQTSAVAVDDVDRVRRTLGYVRINLYGGSYGATTAQIYLLRHGAHVRAAVLDSGSLLDVHIFERQPPNTQRALDMLLSRCAADDACRTAYPDIRGDYRAVMARLARGPIPVPGTGRVVDAAAFARGLDDVIAYTSGKPLGPRLIHLVATGRIARAVAAVPASASPDGQLASQLLIQCSEPWASWRAAPLERASRGTYVKALYRGLGAQVRAACTGMPRADVPPRIGRRVRSDVPVLLLNGAEDGADPPANVAHARRELSNSRTIVFPAAGHGQLGLPCARVLITRFVAAGTARGLDTTCAATAAVQAFDTRD